LSARPSFSSFLARASERVDENNYTLEIEPCVCERSGLMTFDITLVDEVGEPVETETYTVNGVLVTPTPTSATPAGAPAE
jgi:hypothetical protein